jgi:hypothetical protein
VEDFAGFEPQLGEITALRTFRVGPDGRLYPLFSDRPWTDGANTARCNLPITADELAAGRTHATPEPNCTCGFYAYAAVEAAADNAHARHVLAVVACWGNVIAGTRGVRAEHARIEALWMSDLVPRDLADRVATRYPATEIYADQAAMLAEHPPSVLDCYEVEAPAGRNIWLRGIVASAVVIGLLPASWIWNNQDARYLWAAEVGFFVIATALLRLAGSSVRQRGAAILYVGVIMWLVAPFAGSAGLVLLRLPIMQVVGLGLVQRHRLNREARRFPARIAGLQP